MIRMKPTGSRSSTQAEPTTRATRSCWMFLAALGGLILAATGCTQDRVEATPLADEDSKEWIRLFNGSTLDGWIRRGGRADFRVEDGHIVGSTRPHEPNSFLCTAGEYDDFELHLRFRTDQDLNSGVQFRSESLPEVNAGRVHGYQYEIDPSARAWTGGVYDEGRRGWLANLESNPEARSAYRPHDWNDLRLVVQGNHIRTWINGVPAADFHDDMTRSGFIALQVHGVGDRLDPLEVRWSDIRLRPIASPASPTAER